MSTRFSQDYVTDRRIAFAVKQADEIAARHLDLSAYDCAERAVQKVFGRWMLDFTGSVPAPKMPLYLRLVHEVEQQLGVHRRRTRPNAPLTPVSACPVPSVPSHVAAVA